MALSTESRFFGLDLNQLKGDIVKTWRAAPQWPPLSWFRPEQMLTLVSQHGESSVVLENGSPVTHAERCHPVFWAVELPEEVVLRKNLQLPALDPQDCFSAAELEAQSMSPFPQEDLLWGYAELARTPTAVRLQLVLASRARVAPLILERQSQRAQGMAATEVVGQPEVWVFGPQRQPMVIRGFGENLRSRAAQHKQWRNLGAGALAVLLLLAIAVTPTAQLRLRAIGAVKAYDVLAAKTGDVVSKREQVMRSADKITALSTLLSERIDMVKVLSMLTGVLPDTTALQSLRVQGSKATITGLTDNASALMQLLSQQEGIKDVKAPSAATRMPGINKESFSIELALDAKTFGPTLKLEAPTPRATAQDGAGADSLVSQKNEGAGLAGQPSGSQPAPERKGAVLGGSTSGASLGGAAPRKPETKEKQ